MKPQANLAPDMLSELDLLAWQHAYKRAAKPTIQIKCFIVAIITMIALSLTYL
ncbi:hypothetical protein [Methylocucumis oryzae]|uniref:hypothetical protein n=1 Tax=Methylocucumis oryzae TaxID=1632867 RepID=UPI0012FEFF78|nr:hypothetical protein [Methylocucumis oryzae]